MSGQLIIEQLKQRLAGLPQDHEPRERAAVLCELAAAYARAGLPHQGLEAVKETLKLAQSHPMPQEQAEAMYGASMCHYFRADYLMSIASGLDAYQGFSRDQNFVRMGHTLATIAAACKEIKAQDLAIEALNGCLNIAGRTGDVFLEARSRNMLGMVFGDVGRFDEADAELEQSRRCLAKMNDTSHLPKVVANLAGILKQRADAAFSAVSGDTGTALLEQAIKVLRDGVDVAKADGNAYEIADKMALLAEYHHLAGDQSTAMVLVKQALASAHELKHPQIIVEAHLGLGRILLAQNNLAEAESEFKRALELAREAEIHDLQMQIHRGLAECYRMLGQELDTGSHDMQADQLQAGIRHAHQEAQREVRELWERYFSHHPLIGPIA
ncbi:MAG: hypothetical protein JNN20_18135 [Betaproteobacteria bacterium]|nr:hypothetical protein [Betaproteobacteria bacterium]